MIVNAVKMNDFAGEPEELIRRELAACERVLRSGWWILGGEVAAFEREWSEWLGVPWAVGCGNGLDAIEIGLRALEIGEGDEVVTTPMSAFATVLAVIRAGAIPVFADIDPGTGMLSPESVRRCLNGKTKAVLLVHLYGQIGPVEELGAIALKAGAHLLEDCAQAHGAELSGRPAGSFGTFAAWSFYPTKNLGAVGDAGALTTAHSRVAERARMLRNYGQSKRYVHPMLGLNSRLDELQAAILRERLQALRPWIARRREVAGLYQHGIANPQVSLLRPPEDGSRHSYHLYVIRCSRRAELMEYLAQRGIESLIHYPVPVHQQEPCRHWRRDPAGLRFTEEHAATCLSLPCHPGLDDLQVERVISAVNEFGH